MKNFSIKSAVRAGLGTLIWLMIFPALLQAQDREVSSIALKPAPLHELTPPPPPPAREIRPTLKEPAFTLKEAANYNEMTALAGPLTLEQEQALEANRFLLLPKTKYLLTPSAGWPVGDEMLFNFDRLGGSLEQHLRTQQNARFVGPDVFLHALDRYLAQRLAAAEAGPIRRSAEYLLEGLYQNTVALKSGLSGRSAANWERLAAQLAVPLVLIRNGEKKPAAPDDPVPDTLDQALKLFDAYRPDFSKDMADRIKTELERVYQAKISAAGLLGLVPAYSGEEIDYTRFRPRGHYSGESTGRAYYRAMTWLGNLGWSTRSQDGLADALNCALAMSHEPQSSLSKAGPAGLSALRATGSPDDPPPASQEPANLRQAWARVMNINTLFLGLPDSSSYLEWLPFLMKEAGVPEFTPDTAADQETLQRLVAAADSLAPAPSYFRGLRRPEENRIISIFPRRFSLPGIIGDQLTYRAGFNERAPAVFSGLWLPALLGHQYSRDLVTRQLALASESGPPALEDERLRALLKLASADLLNLMDSLAAQLRAEPPGPWSTSLGAAWIRLLAALTTGFSAGHPQYQQGPAYQAKQLETIMGGFTDFRHDPVLSNVPASEPAVPAEEEGQSPAPLVKGFVETNPAFWREMTVLVQLLSAGFAEYGLFPGDLEEMGPLNRFLKRLERCAALSEKELRDEPLTADDYEFIRLFTLDWMAAPPGPDKSAPSVPKTRAAALAPVQSFRLEGGRPSVVYEGNGEPYLMLVLVGNEKTPRLTIGLAYNHYEFIAPHDRPLTDADWERIVYKRYDREAPPDTPPPPEKNFWYDVPLR